MRQNTTTTAITNKEIQIGDSTHNHDQLMKPVSFKPMNSTVSNPLKPKPESVDDVIAIQLISY